MMFSSRFLPCPECGDSIDQENSPAHVCSPVRRAEYQLLRGEQLEAEFRQYLGTTAGRFETWIAARHVRQAS